MSSVVVRDECRHEEAGERAGPDGQSPHTTARILVIAIRIIVIRIGTIRLFGS
jgi:hypothetical protein